MKFCVKCGKGIEKGIFCKECAPPEEELLPIAITSCTCGRTYSEKRWVLRDINDLIKASLPRGYTVKKETFLLPEKGKIATQVTVSYKGKKTPLNVTVTHGICVLCYKQKTQYFDGILQIRGSRPKTLALVHKHLATILKDKERLFIARVEEHKNGADLFMSDKRQMHRMALVLHKKFGGTLTEHPTHFSYNHQSSRNLYRLTILITLPDVEKGDVIDYKNEPILIKKVGTRLLGKNLHDRRSVDLPGVGKYSVVPLAETTVTNIKPHVEALHPTTYQSERLHDAIANMQIGQKIKVALHPRGIYLVHA
jgi:NMD protein affecting ribosome stability and mRNA decay